MIGDAIAFAPIFTHLRTVCNHWCTHSRFGVKDRQCLFGCGHFTDQIAHSCTCPAFWHLFCSIFAFESPPICVNTVLLLQSDWISNDFDRICFVKLGLHTCFLAYNSCRHGVPLSRRLVLNKLYTYTRTHMKATKLLCHIRHSVRELQFKLLSLSEGICESVSP